MIKEFRSSLKCLICKLQKCKVHIANLTSQTGPGADQVSSQKRSAGVFLWRMNRGQRSGDHGLWAVAVANATHFQPRGFIQSVHSQNLSLISTVHLMFQALGWGRNLDESPRFYSFFLFFSYPLAGSCGARMESGHRLFPSQVYVRISLHFNPARFYIK